MPSFNRVMLIGNLTRDPQVKQLPSQTVVAEFGLAMSRKYRTAAGEDKEEVCFVDCAAFGKQAETIGQYMQKGKQIFVEGRLKFDSWEDRAGGGKRSKLSVVVENFQFLGSRNDAASGANGGNSFGGGHEFDAHRGSGITTNAAGTTPSMFDERRDERKETPGTREGREPKDGGDDRKPLRGRTPAAGGRGERPKGPPAEQPFGEEKMFAEADIPF